MKKLLWVVVVALAVAAAGAGYVRWSNADLAELTRARHAALPEVRAALMRYKTDKGRFPERLDMLLPAYLAKVPASLQNAPGAETAMRIDYSVRGENAHFTYQLMRGPDSRETYDVASGTFQRNR